jgi:hypothetical protein
MKTIEFQLEDLDLGMRPKIAPFINSLYPRQRRWMYIPLVYYVFGFYSSNISLGVLHFPKRLAGLSSLLCIWAEYVRPVVFSRS